MESRELIRHAREAANQLIHRNLVQIAGWEWHNLQLKHTPITPSYRQHVSAKTRTETNESYIAEKRELLQAYPEAVVWINESYERTRNNLLIQKVEEYGPVVQGTIMIQLSNHEQDVAPLHFWLSSTKLITMQRDIRIPLRLQHFDMQEQYEQCKNAPEAFFLMLGSLLESLHIGLDRLEQRLGQLERDMKERNRKDLLDTIIERRYELLHYNHMYMPVRELDGLAKEAFLELLTDSDGYQRVHYRFQRLDVLLKHYAIEIDTLISVDDALSNFRGNEIIRTLTIFTAVCLPASIVGAIWGTNFIHLPFKETPLGFVFMIGFILVITGFIYYMFWRKGWTGDILSKRKTARPKEKLNDIVLKQQPQPVNQELPSRKDRGKKQKHKEREQAGQATASVVASKQATLISVKDLPSRKNR